MASELTAVASVELTVLFNEVDAMEIVWHGHYYKYFEAARSKLCRGLKLDMNDFKAAAILAPISKSECKYKKSLKYNDDFVVTAKTNYTHEPKLVVYYTIHRRHDGVLAATGKTEQLFLDQNGTLLFEQPSMVKDAFVNYSLKGGSLKA